MWLEPPAFQEELVKSPTFHNFADPIMHNIVKDIFAWVYLVSTEQITNRMSLQIIEIGYNNSKMVEIDIPAIVCSKLMQAMGRRKRNRKRFCVEGGGWGGGGGGTHTAPSTRDDEPPALLSLACMFAETLKTNEKESYMTPKLEFLKVYLKIILSQFYCGMPAHKSPLN